MASKVLSFLLGNYYTLYHFQELIVTYRIHYDRKHFRRIYETFSQYALYQYRALYPGKQHAKRYRGYPLHQRKQPVYLRFQKYFFLFYMIRCFSIVCLAWTTDTQVKRIWIGTEYGQAEGLFLEATFSLWSTIGFLFCTFSLSNSLLDYKFLAIMEISPKRPEYLRAANLGLTEGELHRLYRFRLGAFFFLHNSMASIPTFGPAVIILLYLRTTLYTTHLFISLFWSIAMVYWIFAISAILYTNLIYFIIVAKYLHLKQKSIVTSLLRSLTRLLTHRQKVAHLGARLRLGKSLLDAKPYMDRLISQNVRYTYLQDELADYNRFWRLYLTYIFMIYVLLIGLMFYIIIFTDFMVLGKFTYGIVFVVNWSILVAIIVYGGKIYTGNERLAGKFASLLGEHAQPSVKLPVLQTIKMNNLSAYLKDASSGFSLLNGHVITYDTLRLLIVNIAIYFILIIKKIV